MVRARAYVFQKLFEGLPKHENFKLIEEELPALKDGEFLAEALYISVDPYMRSFASSSNLGKTFFAEQVANVTESKNKKYPAGSCVIGSFGWRTHTNACERPGHIGFPKPRLLPDIGDLPKSLGLGVLGMTGHTAYFGFLDLCRPNKEGGTIVISAAGGAVGSHVGQIAKILGYRAVGITGTDEKGKWLVDDLGFSAYVNYNDPNFTKALEAATPNGIDSYFDNVGGELSSIVLYKMNKFGKVAVCGSIATYCADKLPKASEVQTPIKINHLKMQGMNVFSYVDRWDEAFNQNLQWLKEGKLKYKETITEGFENTITAFHGLFQGKNIGKAVVKV